jgi:hypothetical protein
VQHQASGVGWERAFARARGCLFARSETLSGQATSARHKIRPPLGRLTQLRVHCHLADLADPPRQSGNISQRTLMERVYTSHMTEDPRNNPSNISLSCIIRGHRPRPPDSRKQPMSDRSMYHIASCSRGAHPQTTQKAISRCSSRASKSRQK